MDRKKFLKNALLGTAGAALGGQALRAEPAAGSPVKPASTYDRLMEEVGFNHLPNEELRAPNAVYHPADSRGGADHSWLQTRHSFSFANYRNPERMSFGVLRVLNDDAVAPGRGFPTHPHDNMEIISIPLSGDLEHQDSMGNTAVIREGDIQVMSAGSGIRHSEYNRNSNKEVRFLQIWLFPRERSVAPRYDQITVDPAARQPGFSQILSPNPDDAGVWIHQDAWFDWGQLPAGFKSTHRLRRNENGLYAFLLEGTATVNGQAMGPRDGYGVWDTASVTVEASQDATLLLMEVPMRV